MASIPPTTRPASQLQTELRKRLPFDSLEQELFLNLWRTCDRLQHDMERLFEDYGLTPQRYNVLRILRGHGEPGLPSLEIAAQMVSRMPDITRLIDRLEAAGLVRRKRSAQDRRVVRISITPKALKVLSKLDQPVLAKHRQQMHCLSLAERKQLNELLVKLRLPGKST